METTHRVTAAGQTGRLNVITVEKEIANQKHKIKGKHHVAA